MLAHGLRVVVALLGLCSCAAEEEEGATWPTVPELINTKETPRGATLQSYALPDISAKLHVYTQNKDWHNSYTIIEGPNEVILFDTPRLMPDAHELKGIAESFGKSLTKIVISQTHPDSMASITEFNEIEHFTGAEQKAWFDEYLIERAPKWAELKLIEELGEHPSFDVLHGQEEAHGAKVESEEEIDGIKFKFITFTTDMVNTATTTLFLPDAGVLLTSGLVVRDSLFKAEAQNWDAWEEALKEFHDLHPALLVPGFGPPAVGYDEASGALETMKEEVHQIRDITVDISKEGLTELAAACYFVDHAITLKPDYNTGSLGDGPEHQHLLPVIHAMYNYMGGFGSFSYSMCTEKHARDHGEL